MEKYSLLPEQLLYEGTLEEKHFFTPTLLSEEHILAVHDNAYWQNLKSLNLSPQEARRTGFPLSDELITRERIIAQGSLQNALDALENGIACNISGGTHHAFSYKGEGFCLLNDIAIAAKFLLKEKKVNQILVIDLDVHQGDGTAQIFQNEPKVFTFSMHGEKNYPLRKEKSDLDVGLPDGISDQAYLQLLSQHLYPTIERVQPDFIFYQAGVDILAHDKLGRLNVSIQGCRQRDKMVLEVAKNNKIPITISMGGGYNKYIQHLIEAHANTFRLVQEIFF